MSEEAPSPTKSSGLRAHTEPDVGKGVIAFRKKSLQIKTEDSAEQERMSAASALPRVCARGQAGDYSPSLTGGISALSSVLSNCCSYEQEDPVVANTQDASTNPKTLNNADKFSAFEFLLTVGRVEDAGSALSALSPSLESPQGSKRDARCFSSAFLAASPWCDIPRTASAQEGSCLLPQRDPRHSSGSTQFGRPAYRRPPHHCGERGLINMPLCLLPADIHSGHVLRMTVTRDFDAENERMRRSLALSSLASLIVPLATTPAGAVRASQQLTQVHNSAARRDPCEQIERSVKLLT